MQTVPNPSDPLGKTSNRISPIFSGYEMCFTAANVIIQVIVNADMARV